MKYKKTPGAGTVQMVMMTWILLDKMEQTRSKQSGPPDLTIHKVDVIIIKRRTGQYRAMRMERRAGDGRRAVMVKETGVGFIGGEVTPVDVEGFDFVAVCATA